MRTIKLILIGPSGVGKTALRRKYITGRFLSGYRTTIGADFITKALPHPTSPEESVTLQIWDTAGQERFSSLSNAFFRGADATLLMFDVNSPESMESLTTWWAQFCDHAPLDEEAMETFCCVLVGNKIDLSFGDSSGVEGSRVTESEALGFLKQLVPHVDIPSPTVVQLDVAGSSPLEIVPAEPSLSSTLNSHVPQSSSIDIKVSQPAIKNGLPKHLRYRLGSLSPFHGGTMSSLKSGISTYHTPSSSLFDEFQSAPSSPVPSSILSPLGGHPRDTTNPITSKAPSSCSAETVTPSLFACESNSGAGTAETTLDSIPDDIINELLASDPPETLTPKLPWTSPPRPLPPFRGPKLFFTSAKTGEGVSEVFKYIADRVVRTWEYEDQIEAGRLHIREASSIVLRPNKRNGLGLFQGQHCCST